jgi:hypothetical protein
MKKSETILIQSTLKEKGLYEGKLDGIRGEKTDRAINNFLLNQSSKIDDVKWRKWNAKRKAIASLQLLCIENDIETGVIDGLYGPQTEVASELLRQQNTEKGIQRGFGDIIPIRGNPHDFPFEDKQSLIEYYGLPCQAQMVRVPCPWQLRLDWDLSQTTRKISIHEKVSGSLARILDNVYAHYGDDGIKKYGLDRYGGSYNCRKKRGSRSSWSTHAWGISIDWFPSRNRLKWRSDRASLAHPELDYWWETWEKEGWLNLGRSEDRDWMHVQAAKR